MPQIFRMGEYWIYFWTNENKPKLAYEWDKQKTVSR